MNGTVTIDIDTYEELRGLRVKNIELLELLRKKHAVVFVCGSIWGNEFRYSGKDEAIKEVVQKLEEAQYALRESKRSNAPSTSDKLEKASFLERLEYLFTGRIV